MLSRFVLFEVVAAAAAAIGAAASGLLERQSGPVGAPMPPFVHVVVFGPQGGQRRAASLAKYLPGRVVWLNEAGNAEEAVPLPSGDRFARRLRRPGRAHSRDVRPRAARSTHARRR